MYIFKISWQTFHFKCFKTHQNHNIKSTLKKKRRKIMTFKHSANSKMYFEHVKSIVYITWFHVVKTKMNVSILKLYKKKL